MPFFFKALTAIFTIVDPIGLVPVVLALTTGVSGRARFITITRAAIIAGIVIAVFGGVTMIAGLAGYLVPAVRDA